MGSGGFTPINKPISLTDPRRGHSLALSYEKQKAALVKATVVGTLAKVPDLLCMEMSAGAEQGYLLASEAGPAQENHCCPTQLARLAVAA